MQIYFDFISSWETSQTAPAIDISFISKYSKVKKQKLPDENQIYNTECVLPRGTSILRFSWRKSLRGENLAATIVLSVASSIGKKLMKPFMKYRSPFLMTGFLNDSIVLDHI